jgi:hypothetical protein
MSPEDLKSGESLRLEAFPAFVGLVAEDARWRPRIVGALDAVTRGLADGRIANPVFQSVKETLNRAVERAWEVSVGDRFFRRGAIEQAGSIEVDLWTDITMFGVYTVIASGKKAAKARKAAAASGHTAVPAIDAVDAFVQEMRPLALAMDRLRPMVVKRQVKTAEEREADNAFVPPPTSSAATKQVRELLEGITEKHHAALLDALTFSYRKELDQFLESAGGDSWRKRAQSSHVVSRCVERIGDWRSYSYRRRPDADQVIADIASKDAKQVRDAFVFKNLKKLCSIIDAKGDLTSAQVVETTVHLSSLRGVLRFGFGDGSGFTVQNSTVLSRSVHNRFFLRFPLTFHDVVMPDGSRMKQPSEERMNTVFCEERVLVEGEDESATNSCDDAVGDNDSPSP